MKRTLLLFLSLICSACVASTGGHSSSESSAAAPPLLPQALQTELPYGDLAQNGIRFGCLPRADDSMHFAIDIVIDSLREESVASLSIDRGERAAPQAGYTNRNVSIEMQRAGQTRIFGTSCWQDAGIGIRGAESALKNLRVSLTAPGTVRVQIMDRNGRSLTDSVTITRQATTERITWTSFR